MVVGARGIDDHEPAADPEHLHRAFVQVGQGLGGHDLLRGADEEPSPGEVEHPVDHLQDGVDLMRDEHHRGDAGTPSRVHQAGHHLLVVEEMPDGWATRVGEGGTALSGGQRQRVSIARALLKDAPILILDEATAALDQENEAVLTSTVQALAAEKTLLVITHRLSTVLAADQVLVMENGRITERGTHPQLAAAGDTYADFWRQRANADGWRLEVAP